jgi:hypothetical protein
MILPIITMTANPKPVPSHTVKSGLSKDRHIPKQPDRQADMTSIVVMIRANNGLFFTNSLFYSSDNQKTRASISQTAKTKGNTISSLALITPMIKIGIFAKAKMPKNIVNPLFTLGFLSSLRIVFAFISIPPINPQIAEGGGQSDGID